MQAWEFESGAYLESLGHRRTRAKASPGLGRAEGASAPGADASPGRRQAWDCALGALAITRKSCETGSLATPGLERAKDVDELNQRDPVVVSKNNSFS